MTASSWKQYEELFDKCHGDYVNLTNDEREALVDFLKTRNYKEASLRELALINMELGKLFEASYTVIHNYIDNI